MFAADFSEVIRWYYFQFLDGCDSLNCTCPDCRSSSAKIRAQVQSPTDAAALAAQYAFDHWSDRLCPGLSVHLCSASLENDIQHFDQTCCAWFAARPFSADQEFIFYRVLFSTDAFPFILRAAPAYPLRAFNLQLDDAKLCLALFHAQQPSFRRWAKVADTVAAICRLHSAVHMRWHIRSLVIGLAFAPFSVDLLNHVLNLPPASERLFFECFMRLPGFMREIVGYLQNRLSEHFPMRAAARIDFRRRELYLLGRFLARCAFESTQSLLFMNGSFTRWVRENDNPESMALRREWPALLSPEFRRTKFRDEIGRRQSASLGTPEYGAVALRVVRGSSVHQKLKLFQGLSTADLTQKLAISFDGEEGGAQREVMRDFFHGLFSQLASEGNELFEVVADRKLWFGPGAVRDPEFFENLGTVVALALFNDVRLPIQFPILLYRKLLKRPIRLIDFAEIYPERANGLWRLLEMCDKKENVAEVGINWSLIAENERNRMVTNDNVEMYVDRYVKKYCNEIVEVPFGRFAAGWSRIFNDVELAPFAPDELDSLISEKITFEWSALARKLAGMPLFRQ